MKKLTKVWKSFVATAVVAVGAAVASKGFFPGVAMATPGGTGNDFNPNTAPGGTIVTLDKLTEWIFKIADYLIYVGVTIAVIFIIWGGIAYMFAGGDPEKAGKAKTRLWNGVIGALIVLGTGVIIRTIYTLVRNGL